MGRAVSNSQNYKLSGNCPAYTPYKAIFGSISPSEPVLKNESEIRVNLKLLEVFNNGSLGRTRTCDPVINSHLKCSNKTKLYTDCPEIVRRTVHGSRNYAAIRRRSSTPIIAYKLKKSTTGNGIKGDWKLAKRFTDSAKWQKEWFRKLDPKFKCIWFYLCDNCDHAGFWPVDMGLMSFQIGQDVSVSDLTAAFGSRIEFVSETKIFIREFIEFQYGELNPKNNVHRSVLNLVEKAGANEGLKRPSAGAQDKAKDKDKDKNKDKEASFQNSVLDFDRRQSGQFIPWQDVLAEIYAPKKPDSQILQVLPKIFNHYGGDLDHFRDEMQEIWRNAEGKRSEKSYLTVAIKRQTGLLVEGMA